MATVDEAPEIFTLQITLKSGATVETDVTDAEYDPKTTNLSWTFPAFWQSKMLHVDGGQIAAIVLKSRPVDAVP